LRPHVVVDFGDVLDLKPRSLSGLGGDAHVDPTHLAAELPGGEEPVRGLALLDHSPGIALQLEATAKPQLARDRKEPTRDPLGVRRPEVAELVEPTVGLPQRLWRDGIQATGALRARRRETGIAEHSEMLRHRRLGDPKFVTDDLGHRAGGELLTREQFEDAAP